MKPSRVVISVIFSLSAFATTVNAKQVIQPNVIWTRDPESGISYEDTNLIALVTMAEAESEDEYGKRLVIDTILNRVRSDKFPDTVRDVIYQSGAFESVTSKRFEECYIRSDICNLVYNELTDTTDEYVYFFRTERYSDYGTPMYKVGNHYFSTY